MIQSIRAMLAGSAFVLGASTLVIGLVPSGPAFAQAAAKQEEAPAKQVELTQKHIDSLLSAQPELAKVQGGGDKPDPKVEEKVEAIAKKAGFANTDEMENVGESVEAVLGGMDSATKTYVGPSALIKKQLAEVQGDKKMPAKDKAGALKELKEALAAGDPPKPSDGNIALVTKNFDKLSQIPGDGK